MVKQGDIIKISFDPQKGHEQKGYRPALVISNQFFSEKTNLCIVCPISNTIKRFPLHVELDERTETTGVVLCEHVRALDITERTYRHVESIPDDILENVLEILSSIIEKQ